MTSISEVAALKDNADTTPNDAETHMATVDETAVAMKGTIGIRT